MPASGTTYLDHLLEGSETEFSGGVAIGAVADWKGMHSAALLMVGSFTSTSFVKQSDGAGETQITHS